MKTFVLNQQHSLANEFLAELRQPSVQKDRLRFRLNLERLGEILAYELSKTLDYEPTTVPTPLGDSPTFLLKESPILVAVLRAGLPFYQGFLRFFDKSDSTFIGAYRGKHNENHEFEIEMHYVTSASVHDKTVIIVDPMLATGKSVVSAYERLLQYGIPKKLHVVATIATNEGLNYIHSQIPTAQFWVGAIDPILNPNFYIVPGLGDAGDLAFGEKI